MIGALITKKKKIYQWLKSSFREGKNHIKKLHVLDFENVK
jgi:hypothetical protein